MTKQEGVWVGLLDMDDARPVVGMSGTGSANYRQARVLIRMHGAPLGQVIVPALPTETLTARARTAAETMLADALHQHGHCEMLTSSLDNSRGWIGQVTCPYYFSTCGGTGVSIVVCTRDRTEGLEECLRTLQQVTYDPFEIIVVDNAPSQDMTWKTVTVLAQDDPRIRYTCELRPGLSRARNHGLNEAKYDIVAFTDDDVMVDSGWPTAVAAGFAADPEVMCVTGLVASRELDTGSQRYFDSRYSWGEAFEPRRYDLDTHRHPSRLYPFSAGIFGTGANFAVRRSAIANLGDFDPLLGAGSPSRGGEDLDMFLRIILAGGRICYLPSSLVWHRHRANIQALSDQIYSYGYGLGAYLAKHLLNRQLPAGILGQGIRQAGAVVGRMRLATQESHLRAGGGRLGFTEARGVMAGALCYYRTSRQASNVPSGVQ
jgi:glycosyltransferase involved in cell wall biosynthesis